MKAKFLVISCGILALASACNNSGESKAKETDTTNAMTTDTTTAMTKDTVVVTPAIDSAAVTREFLAAQKKTKKTTPPKPKKQGTNEVAIYSETPIPAHEALEQPAPAKNAPATEKVVHTKEYVYVQPSQDASYPGGPAALGAYIKKNMVYPDKALQFHVEGTVYAEVSVDSIGHVTKVEFPGTHLGYGLEEETEYVLKNSPRWIPAKENGERVNSKITVPVVYKITH